MLQNRIDGTCAECKSDEPFQHFPLPSSCAHSFSLGLCVCFQCARATHQAICGYRHPTTCTHLLDLVEPDPIRLSRGLKRSVGCSDGAACLSALRFGPTCASIFFCLLSYIFNILKLLIEPSENYYLRLCFFLWNDVFSWLLRTWSIFKIIVVAYNGKWNSFTLLIFCCCVPCSLVFVSVVFVVAGCWREKIFD